MLIGKKISFNNLKTNINNIKLPPGYEVLEYIKNNGQTYSTSDDQTSQSGYGGVIDTGIGVGLEQSKLKIEANFNLYSMTNNWWTVYGEDDSDGSKQCWLLRAKGFRIGSPYYSEYVYKLNTNYNSIMYSDGTTAFNIINGETLTCACSNTTINRSFYIGSCNRSNWSWRVGQLYIGIFRFWYDDKLIGQFVPCKEIITNRCGMFDTITNTFKTSIHSSYQFSDEQPTIS